MYLESKRLWMLLYIVEEKLVIMGSNLQKRIKKLISLGYLDFDETSFIGTLNMLMIIMQLFLIADLQERPFGNLNRILQGFDKFIKLEKTGAVFISEPDIDGLERKSNCYG